MRNNSLLVKFITCFVLFLVIPLVLVSSVFYYYTMEYSENEISASNIGELKIIKNMNEMMIQDLRQNALRLSLDDMLENLSGINKYETTYSTTENMLKIGKTIDVISDMARTNNLIHSIYLYPEQSDFIITSNNGIQLKDNFSDKKWIENYIQHKEGKSNMLLTIPRNLRTGGVYNEYVISLIYPLTGYTTDLKGALVINIIENKLCKLINNNNFENEGWITIINGEGKIISSISEEHLIASNSDNLYINGVLKAKDKQGNFKVNFNNKPYLVNYYKSDFNNWTYISMVPMENLVQRITELKIKVAYYLFVIFVTGILVSIIISKRLYSPVNNLVQNIKKHRDLINKDNKNEMDMLTSAFDALIENEDAMKEAIEKNRRSVKEWCIINLLNGNLNDYDESIIKFQNNNFIFICAVVSINKYIEFLSKYTIEERYYIKNLILNICEEGLKNSYNCSAVILEREKLAMIINLKENQLEGNYIEDILNKLTIVQEQVGTIIDNNVTIGLGQVYRDLQGINLSYKEAMNSLKRKLISNNKKIIVWNEEWNMENEYFYPYNEERHIFNLLPLGVKEDVNSAVDEFFEKIAYKSKKGVSIDNVIQIINQLAGNTIRYLVDNSIKLSDIFYENENIYECILNKDTLEEVEAWFQVLYEKVIDYNNNLHSKDGASIKRIMEYIDENYKKDISIENVADYVGLSYSYVRKVFKAETGKNMLDFINILRVNEAKRLLVETENSIMDIALSIGYNNDQSLSRFFKKYEGIAPGEFRRINKQE